jgi:hypothetical protein
MTEVQRHPLFAGIDWSAVREAPPPKFVMPPAPNPDDLALDWELTSLLHGSGMPVKYEYLPSGEAV